MTSLFYNWNNLPRWGQGSFTQTDVANGEVAPYSQNFYVGYDSANSLGTTRANQTENFSNANFCDGIYYFPLFLHDVSIDLGIAGSTAQAQLTRDFYPHHMVLPSFTIQGQCYDQTNYGKLCEFVHNAQRKPWQSNVSKYPLIQLYIQGNVYSKMAGTRRDTENVKSSNAGQHWNQSIKGQHQDILCLGYIMSMPRVHQTGVYAPTWTCQFMVSTMLSGPYDEAIATENEMSDWVALLTGSGAVNWSTAANEAQNTKDLAAILTASANIISGGSGGGGGGGGGGSQGSGGKWRVTASAESLGGTGDCRVIQADGYSELSTNPSGNLDYAALGNLPCLTPMVITNPANNQSVTTVKQDRGAGGGPSQPVMGLYPGTVSTLGLQPDSMYTVDIQLASGSSGNLKPVRGTKIS